MYSTVAGGGCVAMATRAGAFWVIETNYDFALIYSCAARRDDGACDVSAQFAYVISRRRTLHRALLRRVDFIVRRRLCIDSSRLQFTRHSRTCASSMIYAAVTTTIRL